MKLKAAIIDDERHCIETLQYDLENECNDVLDVVFTCSKSIDCVKKMREFNPDIMFLDIEMPGISGFDLLKIIEEEHISVVFTTAHARHAVEAISFKPDGYLLKPVDSEELQEVVQRIFANHQKENHVSIPGKLAISKLDEIELISHSSIIIAKANNNYTEIITSSDKPKLVSKTLKYIEERLPINQFYRVHKSYLVNLNHINKYVKAGGGVLIMSNGNEVPVSPFKKDALLSLIQD